MRKTSIGDSGASQDDIFGHRHVTVIEPSRGWRPLDLAELWAYRELLWVLAVRDVRVRYKQTILGAGWAILRPLLTMLIFTLVFGRLAKMPSEGFPYSVWVYAALVPWTFFAGAVGSAGQSLVGSAHLISKVYFPRLIVPISSIGSALVDLVVSSAVLLVLMALNGVSWTWNLLAAPLLLLGVALTALGIGTLMSALTVNYRDFSHVLPFLLQIWMYVSPVVYPASLVPERWRLLYFLNPMAGLSEGFRSAFLGKPFDLTAIGFSTTISIGIFIAGVVYFEHVERRFADVI